MAPKRPELSPAAFARHFGRVKRAAGFDGKEAAKAEDGQKLRPRVQNYMRHAAISMHLAKHKRIRATGGRPVSAYDPFCQLNLPKLPLQTHNAPLG